jgi:hypothetical protein
MAGVLILVIANASAIVNFITKHVLRLKICTTATLGPFFFFEVKGHTDPLCSGYSICSHCSLCF